MPLADQHAPLHNAANEYLGLIERAENGGGARAYANWTAPSSGQ